MNSIDDKGISLKTYLKGIAVLVRQNYDRVVVGARLNCDRDLKILSRLDKGIPVSDFDKALLEEPEGSSDRLRYKLVLNSLARGIFRFFGTLDECGRALELTHEKLLLLPEYMPELYLTREAKKLLYDAIFYIKAQDDVLRSISTDDDKKGFVELLDDQISLEQELEQLARSIDMIELD